MSRRAGRQEKQELTQRSRSAERSQKWLATYLPEESGLRSKRWACVWVTK